jgi:arylsulfatase A-like enzyme
VFPKRGGKGVRSATATCLACVVGAAAGGCSSSNTDVAASSRPNIVLILADDLDSTVMPFWQAMPRTKELLADRGMTFTNSFAVNPVCCPARAAVLSGKYSHDTGVFDHSPPDGGYATFVRTGAEQDTIATRLHDAGYTTGFVGKYLNGYEETPQAVPPGWDEWFGLSGSFLDGYTYGANHNGKMEKYGSKRQDYQTDVLSRRTQSFVSKAEKTKGKPFFLFLSPSSPHATIGPAPRERDNKWNHADFKKYPNYNEADVSDKPTWLRVGKPPIGAKDTAMLTRRYRNGMGSLLAVDDMVSSLARRLRADHELDNTVFLFAGDNGNSWGAHRQVNKQVPYEEAIRVPLVVSGPGIRHGTTTAMAGQIDYAPTLLELAGVKSSDLDGRSLVPFLHGVDPPWRDDLLIEYRGTTAPLYTVDTFADVRTFTDSGGELLGPPTYRALRTEQYLYVEWYGGPEHEYELYDVRGDPYELSNLVATDSGRQKYASQTTAFHARLDALTACNGPTCHT